MWTKTKFTNQFNLEFPIIQGPFGGGLSSVSLTTTVSNLGGLGSFGADAVQIGTAFLVPDQSNATEEHKRKLFSPEAKYTTLTKIFSGRLRKGLRNKLTEELKDKENLMAPYPMQKVFPSFVRNSLQAKQKLEYSSF